MRARITLTGEVGATGQRERFDMNRTIFVRALLAGSAFFMANAA